MNAVYKTEKYLCAAVLALVAVVAAFAVAVPADAAVAYPDNATADAEDQLPTPFVDFEISLGYDPLNFRTGEGADYDGSEPRTYDEIPEEYNAHDKYWTLSVDFTDSIMPNYYWPYGSDAYLKVTFFFYKDGTVTGVDNKSTLWFYDLNEAPALVSKSINVPVFQLADGSLFANDVLCTPDMWPNEAGVSVYPVYAEAILLYKLPTCPDTVSNKCQVLGWDNDFAAFEYVVKYLEKGTEVPVVDKDTGNVVKYNYGWADWGTLYANGSSGRNAVTVPAAYNHLNPEYDPLLDDWSDKYIIDGVPGYKLVSPDYQTLDPVETPDYAPQHYMVGDWGFESDDVKYLIANYKNGKNLYNDDGFYSWPNWPDLDSRAKPAVNWLMYDAYLLGLNPLETYDGIDEIFIGAYNEIIFYYEPATYDVLIKVCDDDSYGYVIDEKGVKHGTDGFYVTVQYGDVLTADDIYVYLDGAVKSTAEPYADTFEFSYSFMYYDGALDVPIKEDGNVICAHFERSLEYYEVIVKVADPSLGMGKVNGVDEVSLGFFPAHTVISWTDNVVTVEDKSATATPVAADSQYTYEFVNYTGATEVTQPVNYVYANFKAVDNYYPVDVVIIESGWGTVGTETSSFFLGNFKYGDKISIASPSFTVGSVSKTAVPAKADVQYTYSLVSISVTAGDADAVRMPTTITVVFDRVVNDIPVKFAVCPDGPYGTVTVTEIVVPYGTQVFGSKTPVFTLGNESTTAVPFDDTDEYTYGFLQWNNVPSVIDRTGIVICAQFTQEKNDYRLRVYTDAADCGDIVIGTLTTDDWTCPEGVPYGTNVTVSGKTLKVLGYTVTAVENSDDMYNYYFDGIELVQGSNPTKTYTEYVVKFHKEIKTFDVRFVVASDSTGMGSVTLSLDAKVPYGTPVSWTTGTDTVKVVQSSTAVPAKQDLANVYTFASWTGADDRDTALPDTITGPTTLYAHFDATAIPYSVVIKYMCDGQPIKTYADDGKLMDIAVNTQATYGADFSYQYEQNPLFLKVQDKYILQSPASGVVGKKITETLTVFEFVFEKKDSYVQFHRQDNPVPNPVYYPPAEYGESWSGLLQASEPADKGKHIQVLITDDATGQGAYIGAGQSATYHGATYSVTQKDVIDGYDAVTVTVSGELMVYDDPASPLKIWYRLV